ncbi:hypothetical protein TNCV_1689151 [Trichonephila clavipes]|nr:hypothetical protein TNCV_1689151 [Trichonephila clavipes]
MEEEESFNLNSFRSINKEDDQEIGGAEFSPKSDAAREHTEQRSRCGLDQWENRSSQRSPSLEVLCGDSSERI